MVDVGASEQSLCASCYFFGYSRSTSKEWPFRRRRDDSRPPTGLRNPTDRFGPSVVKQRRLDLAYPIRLLASKYKM